VFFPSGKKIVAFFLSWKKVQIGGHKKWPIVCCLAISLWLACGPRIKNFRALKIFRDFFPTWKKRWSPGGCGRCSAGCFLVCFWCLAAGFRGSIFGCWVRVRVGAGWSLAGVRCGAGAVWLRCCAAAVDFCSLRRVVVAVVVCGAWWLRRVCVARACRWWVCGCCGLCLLFRFRCCWFVRLRVCTLRFASAPSGACWARRRLAAARSFCLLNLNKIFSKF
jgi:hypothetical protein